MEQIIRLSSDRTEQGAQQVNAGYVVFRAFTTSSSLRTQLPGVVKRYDTSQLISMEIRPATIQADEYVALLPLTDCQAMSIDIPNPL